MTDLSNISQHFDFLFKESLVINRPSKRVYEAIWDLKTWPRLLPHVHQVDVQYDDGIYQEFMMTVSGRHGDALVVRSIRKRLPSEIDFFQPVPPEFLKHHAGRWIFNALQNDACELATCHFWNLSSAAKRMFPVRENSSTEEQVEQLLREHARLALSSWKKILEKNQ